MSIRGSKCAWCGAWLTEPSDGDVDHQGDQGGISHGVCSDCIGDLLDLPVTDVYDLGSQDVDRLAFGLIELADDGTVRQYNAAESRLSGLDPADVIGKKFFTEVAPCTKETEFERRWLALRDRGEGRDEFTFVFRFKTGHQIVQIRTVMKPGGNTLILVQPEP